MCPPGQIGLQTTQNLLKLAHQKCEYKADVQLQWEAIIILLTMRGRFCFWPSVHSLTHLDQCQTSPTLPVHFYLSSFATFTCSVTQDAHLYCRLSLFLLVVPKSASMFNSVAVTTCSGIICDWKCTGRKEGNWQKSARKLFNRLKMSDIARTRPLSLSVL